MELQPREYRFDPALRRCCWYVIGSGPVFVAVFYWAVVVLANRPPIRTVPVTCAFGLLTVAVSLPLRWRLVVDNQGLARRWLFRWERWTWDDISSGRIRKLHTHTLYDPKRPWYRRRLTLRCMASTDIHEVLSVVNAHYQLPPAPHVPAEIEIRYGFRRRTTMDANGIHLLVAGRPATYLWHDVRNVHIVRLDPVRRDFWEMTITLPDQVIEFRMNTTQAGTYPTWQGATAEELNEMLFACVEPEKIDILISGEVPTNRECIEKKLHEARKSLRSIQCVAYVGTALMAALLIWIAAGGQVFRALWMAGAYSVYPGSLVAYLMYSQRKQIDALQNRLASNDDPRSNAGNAQGWKHEV